MTNEEKRISFHVADRRPVLTDRSKLKRFISAKIREAGYQLNSLDYVFCSDDYLLKINQQHLNHDDFTDIITFDLSEQKMPLEGEVYISLDRVRENASLYNERLNRELHRVIFHGVLHLIGFKDKTPRHKQQMRNMEEQYLTEYGFSPK